MSWKRKRQLRHLLWASPCCPESGDSTGPGPRPPQLDMRTRPPTLHPPAFRGCAPASSAALRRGLWGRGLPGAQGHSLQLLSQDTCSPGRPPSPVPSFYNRQPLKNTGVRPGHLPIHPSPCNPPPPGTALGPWQGLDEELLPVESPAWSTQT